MMKSSHFLMIIPLIFNMLIISIMMIPSKINNFHPISLLLILITMIFLICLKMNFSYKSWIPFILFLIMIGGLMVIFMYITSLANNEFFNFNIKFLMLNLIKMMSLLLLMILMMLIFKQLMFNLIINPYNINNFMNVNNQLNINIMYKELNNKSSYFIMIYLYYSMICIMNICYKLKAPLRQMLF